MVKKLFILFLTLISFNVWGLCNFPHNPAAYCLKFKVLSQKLNKNTKPFQCELVIDLKSVYRPKNTYAYDDNLNKTEFKKNEKIDISKSDRIKETKKLYVKAKKCKKEFLSLNQVVSYLSCYDTWENIPDFSFLTDGEKVQDLYDPWTQTYKKVSCEFLK
ncbi:MAG: hypothetical protein ACPGJV_03425 [Bacteriovoracaceae bacterium]